MLTDLEHIPSRRPARVHRSGSVIPCSLPDSQALLELSLREIETTVDESQSKLQSLHLQLSAGALQNPGTVDQIRQALRSISTGYSKHLEVIQERIDTRHHPEGRFGSAVAKLCAELSEQIDRLLIDQQQLGELSAQQSLELAACGLNDIAANLQFAVEQLATILQVIRNGERQPHSITIGGAHRATHERTQLRDQLAWSLRRWWQTCTVQPGPMTIAVIDLHRLSSDYPELSHTAVEQMLNAAASLIASDRRTGRPGLAIDTTVISEQGDERNISWNCAVIEDNKGHVQSIIAAGLDKSKPKSARELRTAPTAAPESQVSTVATASPATSERRRKQRNPFPYVQLVAPTSASGLPATSAFSEMLCHDISEDGFSFLSATMPTTTTLVVALGTRPPHLYMTARVAHFTRCETVSGAKYIVGCQFTGRAMVMAQFA